MGNGKEQERKEAESLFHHQANALGVTVELGSIHALNVGHASLILAAVLYAHGIFKDIDSFGQVIQIEVRSRVAGGLIVTQAILVLVAG